MTEGANEAEKGLVRPLFQFRNYGQQLPHHWTTISNESAFGVDYYTRTAAAKSNIPVNTPAETKYFYQDLDADGTRLNSANRVAGAERRLLGLHPSVLADGRDHGRLVDTAACSAHLGGVPRSAPRPPGPACGNVTRAGKRPSA
jgi:hypothetical protein